MTRWRAVVPLKLGAGAKSRLAGLLSPDARAALSLRMARHVLGALDSSGRFDSITLLSTGRPDWWSRDWAQDMGSGLNAELMRWRTRHGAAPVLVIHADLPLLAAREVARLLDAAETFGTALATDRAGEGSNALAIADGRAFSYCFGPKSRSLHTAQDEQMPVLAEPGLSLDLDTGEDLAIVEAHGCEIWKTARD